MRLQVLDSGHGFGTKLLFSVIRLFSGYAVLDVVKLVRYRPDFYGKPMSAVTQEAMRGPSGWTIAERETMAAFVAKANGSDWCTQAHSAVANRAYRNTTTLAAVLSDLETAPIDEPLRATLRMLRNLVRTRNLEADDMRAVLVAGASAEQIEDALAVCFAFSTIGRLAAAFGFADPGSDAFDAGAKYLLARGYR